MAIYRKRPIEINAICWTGKNLPEIRAFLGHNYFYKRYEDQAIGITTLDSVAYASIGDWVLKGELPGDFYPCKPQIFEATYESA